MTDVDRFIEAADALAERVRRGATHHKNGQPYSPSDPLLYEAYTEYRAAREAITAAGVNDMNEGKEG